MTGLSLALYFSSQNDCTHSTVCVFMCACAICESVLVFESVRACMCERECVYVCSRTRRRTTNNNISTQKRFSPSAICKVVHGTVLTARTRRPLFGTEFVTNVVTMLWCILVLYVEQVVCLGSFDVWMVSFRTYWSYRAECPHNDDSELTFNIARSVDGKVMVVATRLYVEPVE